MNIAHPLIESSQSMLLSAMKLIDAPSGRVAGQGLLQHKTGITTLLRAADRELPDVAHTVDTVAGRHLSNTIRSDIREAASMVRSSVPDRNLAHLAHHRIEHAVGLLDGLDELWRASK